MSYPMKFGWAFSDNKSDWADFGKYLAGTVGPLFALLAFVGVIISIRNQNDRNQDNLDLSQRQATEGIIIKHIDFHHNICDKVKSPLGGKSKVMREGRLAFDVLYNKHLKTYYLEISTKYPNMSEEDKINNAFTKLYDKYGYLFGFYFRNLFYLIKYIDDSENIDENHYAKLVRAQLSKSEIQLLMYNCLFDKGKPFKSLVTKYGLLNGIDEDDMIEKLHKTLFESQAFG